VFNELACDLHYITTIDLLIITKTFSRMPNDFKVVSIISNESLAKELAARMVLLVVQAGMNPGQITSDIKDSGLSSPETLLAYTTLREHGFFPLFGCLHRYSIRFASVCTR